MANLTNELDFVSLSTSAMIIAKMDLTDAGDSRTSYVDSIISEVSTMMGSYLGVHTRRAERTERYKLRRFSKRLQLDANEVASTGLVIRASDRPSELASATPLVADEEYILNGRTGLVELFGNQAADPLWFEVTYTGGYFETTSDIGKGSYQWLSDAAEMQILYRLQRQDTLGGNVDTTGGQGTNFTVGQYNWLPQVRDALRRRRRVHV